jgi:hypothetical protein
MQSPVDASGPPTAEMHAQVSDECMRKQANGGVWVICACVETNGNGEHLLQLPLIFLYTKLNSQHCHFY